MVPCSTEAAPHPAPVAATQHIDLTPYTRLQLGPRLSLPLQALTGAKMGNGKLSSDVQQPNSSTERDKDQGFECPIVEVLDTTQRVNELGKNKQV